MPGTASQQPPPVSFQRRRLLGATLAAGAALALPGCVTRGATGPDRLRLARPRIDPALVIREVAGLRPYRPAGFRVQAERIGDTLLVHNYGHGGCGVTLSWGTAKLALDLALQQPERRATVIGCGAVGLATARLLQDHGFSVDIQARELPPDTVSNVAGAQWAPSSLVDEEYRTPAFGAQLGAAMRFAHRYFQLLPDIRYGVRWMPLHIVSQRPQYSPGWLWEQAPELVRSRTHAPGTHPFGARHVHEVQTMIIEPSIYLPALVDAFRLAGGRIHVRGFRSVEELRALGAPLVFNCTGLGARALVDDPTMVPIKGQLTVLAPQPQIDYAVIGGGHYLFPRRDGIQLGGTFERGEWSTAPDAAVSARLLDAHRRLFASL